jgi:hypothetical protein
MSIGYINSIEEAENYFAEERLASTCWDDYTESGDARKIAVLTQAYNRMYYSGIWELPVLEDVESEEYLKKLEMAQLEIAYYFCCHLEDEDRRKGLQAQGVKKAGIVKEHYTEKLLNELPFPSIVYKLLSAWEKKKGVYCLDLTRDEDL